MSTCCCNQSDNIGEDWTIYGPSFTSDTEYKNPFLKGRFRITLRGDKRLTRGVDWDYIPEGGFKILIPGFAVTDDVAIDGEYY